MRIAYEEFYLGKFKEPANWMEAQHHHQMLLRSPKYVDMQFESPEISGITGPTKL